MEKEISMRRVFNQLVKECGFDKGREIFEWYCQTYGLDISSMANNTIKYEVFGIC